MSDPTSGMNGAAATTSGSVASIRLEEEPSRTSNRPDSTTQLCDAVSQNANARRGSRRVTTVESPGSSATFAKAFSSCSGR